MQVRFDDSLPTLVALASACLTTDRVKGSVVVRDVSGRLSIILRTECTGAELDELHSLLTLGLGSYARPDRVVVALPDPAAMDLLASTDVLKCVIAGVEIGLIDRRLVGGDWLRAPAAKSRPPARFVFASLKGGVGRSTALSVAAVHLAGSGRRVLAVDLDMEAPGLGALLLDQSTLPTYGVIDALVEDGLSGLDDELLANIVGPSPLAAGHGRIDVVPAFGKRSLDNPADVLSKLARAYAEDLTETGVSLSLMDQIGNLLTHLADPRRYDVVLVDARAGLHETSAAAILGLGAEVFLFGLDEPQTFQGYAALFAHLSRFIAPGSEAPEWVERLCFVQGKAPLEAELRVSFADSWRTLLSDTGFLISGMQTEGPLPPAAPFRDVPWDDELPDELVLPHDEPSLYSVLPVFEDPTFKNFNPLAKRDVLLERLYMATFGPLLERVEQVINAPQEAADA